MFCEASSWFWWTDSLYFLNKDKILSYVMNASVFILFYFFKNFVFNQSKKYFKFWIMVKIASFRQFEFRFNNFFLASHRHSIKVVLPLFIQIFCSLELQLTQCLYHCIFQKSIVTSFFFILCLNSTRYINIFPESLSFSAEDFVWCYRTLCFFFISFSKKKR